MRPDDEDRLLRDAFAALREEDRRDAPRFADSWNGALERERRQTSGGGRWALWLGLPLGAAALLALAALLIGFPTSSPEGLVDGDSTVADWTAASGDWLGLQDVGFLELGGQAREEVPLLDDPWRLPSDALLEQVEGSPGREREI